jgi:hypothetical protein
LTELGASGDVRGVGPDSPQGTRSRSNDPVFILWGLTAVSRPDAEDVLAGQAGTGARIANLRIKVRTRFPDLLVTVLTFGVFAPRSVTFEGVVVPH